MSRLGLFLPLLLVPLLACATRTVREPVFKQNRVEVFLRGQKKGDEYVDQGFDQPAEIAPVRMAHILSRIDLRGDAKDGLERMPLIELDALYTIADGLSQGLAKAGPGQEVCVRAIKRTKNWKIFDHFFLTSFLAYMKDDLLYIHLSRHNWEIPPRREDQLPEPHVGDHPMKFHAIAGRAMTMVDSQSLAVQWRDPVFRRPTRTRITPGGEVIRKTILMESLEEDVAPPVSGNSMPANLSAQTLRDLADLEEERTKGLVSEHEYQIRRRKILGEDPASTPAE